MRNIGIIADDDDGDHYILKEHQHKELQKLYQ